MYAATLAPDVTWWDSGEMIAAAHSLGIPHPPGVPLYVLITNVASRVLWWMGPAASVNFFSAICVACACGLGAAIVASITRSVTSGIGSGICAGGLFTVWATATEAEVYGPSLLLSVLMLWTAWRSAEKDEPRMLLLTAFFIALAAPLHLSALVAAPAAILIASWKSDGHFSIARAIQLCGVALVSAGVGKASPALIVAGILLMFVPPDPRLRSDYMSGAPRPLLFAVTLLAVSAILFMPLRAAWDPLINQGNPVSVQSLVDVLSRSQYDVAPMLPRQAPLWLQIANYFQYLDWQFALGVAPSVLPSPLRTIIAILFVAIAYAGFLRVGSGGIRAQWFFVILFASASAGVLLYLNFKAGPTIGFGILPDSAPHEARERDYFFVLSFWTLGLLAGAGAVHLAKHLRTFAVPSGLALACLPVVLNHDAVNRAAQPAAALPARFASALLTSLPERAVIFVGGDNDTYPLWYLQSARNVRRDVTVITIPLLGAEWYRAELRRRHDLLSDGFREWRGIAGTAALIRARATTLNRPITVAVTVPAAERAMISESWVLTGFHYRAPAGDETVRASEPSTMLDIGAIERAVALTERGIEGQQRQSIDPIGLHMARFLECPVHALDWSRGTGSRELLDSSCNFR